LTFNPLAQQAVDGKLEQHLRVGEAHGGGSVTAVRCIAHDGWRVARHVPSRPRAALDMKLMEDGFDHSEPRWDRVGVATALAETV
jgi:hypothetical protein